MPTYILRPSADAGETGPGFTYSSGSTAYNLLNDSSILSYIQSGGSSERTKSMYLDDATGTIPGSELIVAVTPYLQLYDSRGSLNSSSLFDAKIGILEYGQTLAEGATWVSGTGTSTLIKGPRCTQVPGLNVDWTLGYLDSLFIFLRSQVSTAYYEAYVVVETTSTGTPDVTAPSGTTADRTPTITWTYSLGQEYQGGARVKIFDDATYGGGGFDPETSTPDASTEFTGTNQSWAPTTLLADDTYRAYVWVKHIGTDSWYGPDYLEFTVSDPVQTPTMTTPVDTATVATSLPYLAGTVTAQTGGAKCSIEWLIASDSGFTNNTQVVTGLSYTSSGTVAGFPATPLTQGTWYIKARAIDEFGTYGSYTAAQTFVVAHAPAPTGMSPSGGSSNAYSTTQRVSWTFTDPYPGDSQTAYQVQIGKGTNYTATIDTGTVTSANAYYDATIDSSYKDVDIWWRVRVRDGDSVWSPWSALQIFHANDPATIAITSPTNGGTVSSPSPTVTWTFTASGGRTQSQYRVIVTDEDTSTEVYNSGWLTGSALSYAIPTPVVDVSVNYSVTVEAKDNYGLTGSDTNDFTASYSLPDSVTPTITSTTYSTDAKVTVSWTTTPDGSFVAWRVYRRVVGGTWTLVATITDSGTTSYDDYLAPTNTALQYAVAHVATRFSEDVESAYVTADFEGTNTFYTLVCPDDTSLNCILYGVRGDSFSDERDMAVLRVIGRGRVYQQGTVYGRSGSLDVAFNDLDAATAREQRIAVEDLRDSGLTVYLRNPFGDVWAVSLINMSVDRVPGIGQREHTTAQIGYSEVAV